MSECSIIWMQVFKFSEPQLGISYITIMGTHQGTLYVRNLPVICAFRRLKDKESNGWRLLLWIRADIDQVLLSSLRFDKLFQFLQPGCFYAAVFIVIWLLVFLLLIIAYWDLRNFICLTLDLWKRSWLLWTFQPPALKSVERSNSKLGLLLQY